MFSFKMQSDRVTFTFSETECLDPQEEHKAAKCL